VRARLHAAGSTLLLAATLGAAMFAADAEITLYSTPATLALTSPGLTTDPHPWASHHLAISTIIPPGRTMISVPILLYHYVQNLPPTADRLTYNLSVSVAAFTSQMDWLAAHGYHPVTIEDLDAYFTHNQVLPSKPVIITLDDGYRDLYTTAYPILKAHGFRAVAYIVSSFVGRLRYVTSAMITEMAANGIEIASHTVDHPNLTHTSPPMVTYEVVYSKSWLEKLLGQAVVDFAYPSGRFNDAVIQQLEKAGYESAVTEIPGTYHSWADRFEWSRVRVSGGETLPVFITDLGPVEPYITVKPSAS
jgi:peptidoglycan/xylan/chitin deacetylase (PgdA/CDA1 family)